MWVKPTTKALAQPRLTTFPVATSGAANQMVTAAADAVVGARVLARPRFRLTITASLASSRGQATDLFGRGTL
jgi:hypothetical protein